MKQTTQHTSDRTASGFFIHSLSCPACLEHDQAEVEAFCAELRQADLDAEEGYRELQATVARGEAIPETTEF